MSRKGTRGSTPENENAEVVALREQLRLLQLENEALRNRVSEYGDEPPRTPRRATLAPDQLAHGTPKGGRKGCGCKSKGNCSTRICGCRKRNIPCGQFCKCGEQCQNLESNKENIDDVNESKLDNQKPQTPPEIPPPAQLKEEPEEEANEAATDELAEPDELKQAVVEDWDQHIASLVKCAKCGRKLYPHRIKKHEATCKKV